MPQLEEASKSPSEEVVVEIGGQEYRFQRRRYESPWLYRPSSHGGTSGRPPSPRSDDAEIEHAGSDELSDESDSIASPDVTPPPEPKPEPGRAVHPFGVIEGPSPTASERARWREIDEPDTSRQRYFSREEQEYFNALYERGWSPVEQPPRNEHAVYVWRPNQEIVKDVPNEHRADPNRPEALVLKVPDYQGKPEPPMKPEDMPKVVRFWLTKKDDEFENAEGREITERLKNSEKIQPAAGRPKSRIKRVKAMIQEETSAWWKEAIQAEAGDPAVARVGTPEVTIDKGASPVADGPADTTNPWAGRLRKRPSKPPKDEVKPPAKR
ncbi:MAG: hypothetical protein Q9214_007523, partial [Letrouitia sp. 1 TL-2023]